jgi:Uma2 family endonuclease
MGMPRVAPRLLKGPFTVADYHRMAEAGVLSPDARVELLDGQVVEMNPIGSRHAGCVNRLTRMLTLAAGERATVAIQNPAILDDFSEPQPDVAVMRFRPDGYATRHPGPADVLLLIEVMVTSADLDREVKAPLYARAGVPEVWLVDLEAGAIEVRRDPAGEGYRQIRTVARGDTLTPPGLPGVALAVNDILD